MSVKFKNKKKKNRSFNERVLLYNEYINFSSSVEKGLSVPVVFLKKNTGIETTQIYRDISRYKKYFKSLENFESDKILHDKILSFVEELEKMPKERNFILYLDSFNPLEAVILRLFYALISLRNFKNSESLKMQQEIKRILQLSLKKK